MSQIKPFKRGAGILLPISSLPSNYGIGTLGDKAYEFVDFLKKAGQKYWQVLPVGPTSFGDSPYQSFSAFAGNPYFIDLDYLIEQNLISKEDIEQFDWGDNEADIDYAKIFNSRFKVLKIAFKKSKHSKTKIFEKFCSQNKIWLDDYCLYMSLKEHFDNKEWLLWDEDIRMRKQKAVVKYQKELKEQIEFWKFCQFKFFEQWNSLKKYANKNKIKIIGDIPIYVALDSADVWVNSNLFELDENKQPINIAGVPPDMFSETGQRWGNPLYNWEEHERTNFNWWRNRMAFSAKLYDVIRIDHFIGIVRYYSIPSTCPTAVEGSWKKGPGKKLTDAINASIGKSKIVAEDLGVVNDDVKELLKYNNYPNMKILEFAFDSDANNDHLPHNYNSNMFVYGGTHDNETLVGFVKNKQKAELKYAMKYLNVSDKKDITKAIIRLAYASVANVAIFQMQDILGLDNSARMNFPSTIGTNWRWRLLDSQLTTKMAKDLCKLAGLYGRKNIKSK